MDYNDYNNFSAMKGVTFINKEKGYKKKQRIEFSNRLKEVMDLRGLKIFDVAVKSKIPEQQISEYVNGRYMPRPRNLIMLAESLGVNYVWLTGESEDFAPDNTITIPESMNTESFLLKVSDELLKRNNTDTNDQKIYYNILSKIINLNHEGLTRTELYLEDINKIDEYKKK